MLRSVLITYLCLATVVGPSLCCCNAQRLIAMVEGVKCCGKRAHSEIPSPERHKHCSHHEHAHHHHAKPELPNSEATKDISPAEHQHDKQNCPCGEHHAKLVATLTVVANWNGVDLQNSTLGILANLMLALPEVHVNVAVSTDERPAHLYGREMLRAYQIMRC